MSSDKQLKAEQKRKQGFLSKRLLTDLAVALLLALLASAIWITNADLWNRADWDLPVDYGGDSHQILGWIKAASEGDYHLLDIIYVSRLGAPFGANWNDYPMYEKAFTILLGIMARSLGLMAAANAGMMLTHALATASFYLACRWFRWHRIWSMVGALLFGFLYYNTMRSLGHLLLGLTYTIPWAVLSSWLIANRQRIPRFSRTWKFCLFTSFLMGISNPYYLNIYVQLVILSMVIVWFNGRRRDNLEAGFCCLVSAGAAFVFIHTGTLLFRFFAGTNPYALVRTYREAELYALRPIELFIPPRGHHFSWLSEIGFKFQVETFNQGEIFSPYLGLIGIGTLIALIGLSLHRLLRNRAQQIPLPFWQILWVLAYSVVGGVNCWLAFSGIGVFRASNRNSLFIAGLLLLWLVPQLRRLTKNWSIPKTAVCALILTTFAITDQLPYANREAKRPKILARMNADRTFSELLESNLPPESMVFQLPLAEFPEGHPVFEMDSYEHLRPYFFSHALRFSYGSNKGRSDSSWQAEISRLPARTMIERLESLGFGALIINRKGYPDKGAALLFLLDRMGYQARVENGTGDMVALLLRPVKEPELPRIDTHPINNYGQLWRRLDMDEDNVHWLNLRDAEIQINHAAIKSSRAHFAAQVRVPTDRTIYFTVGKKVLHKQALTMDVTHEVTFDFDLADTGTPIHIETDRPAANFMNTAGLKGAFIFLKLEITGVPAGE
jgi:hypothetical protein